MSGYDTQFNIKYLLYARKQSKAKNILNKTLFLWIENKQ